MRNLQIPQSQGPSSSPEIPAKTQCDGNHPCSQCIARRDQCLYSANRIRAQTLASSKEYVPSYLQPERSQILALQDRIAVLEGQLASAGHVNSPTESFSTDNSLHEVTDGVHAINLRTQKAEFYGPSSSQYFFDRLCSTFPSNNIKPNEDNTGDIGGSSAASEGRVIHEPIMSSETDVQNSPRSEKDQKDDDLLECPFQVPREEADRLLSAFWLEIAPQLPIFDENEFWWAYKNLWNTRFSDLGDDSVEIRRNRLELMWDIVLVDMVFALVTQHAAMRNMSGDFGDEHFERARDRLGDIFGSANFGSVRCLILIVVVPNVFSNRRQRGSIMLPV